MNQARSFLTFRWPGAASSAERLSTPDLPLNTDAMLVPGVIHHTVSGPARLEVVHGVVWLTRTGDADDHFLAGGEGIDVPDGARAWVEVESRRHAGAAVVRVVPKPSSSRVPPSAQPSEDVGLWRPSRLRQI